MNLFYEPVNINQWNMFEKVSGVGHIEPFLATKSMSKGDIVLLHVGQQNKKYQSGVYAIGKIVREPYILKDHPDDYCNNKNTVDIQIIKIDYSNYLISHDECKQFIKQFRTVHKIENEHYEYLMNLLNI